MKHEITIGGFILISFCGGCAHDVTYSPDQAPEYMTDGDTKFFLHGPLQPGLPDELPPQTFVHVLRKEYGYSLVQLSDGRSGYVANENIRVAPPDAPAVSTAELFPETDPIVNEPEPDLTLPVAEMPAPPPSKKKADGDQP
jgi:hypothetical protein